MSKKIGFIQAHIAIKKENFLSAFIALKEALIKEHSLREGNENKLLWMKIKDVQDSSNLIELLRVTKWEESLDQDDNIEELSSMIMLLGEDELVFGALAPYIEDNGKIVLFAEDGSLEYAKTVFLFKSGKMLVYHESDMEELTNFLLEKAFFKEVIEPSTPCGRALAYLSYSRDTN